VLHRKRARTARGRVVVRPKWPGEDDTGGSSPDPSEAYSSADEASHAGWAGVHIPMPLDRLFVLLHC
jgi:hypothetical protein